jgi:4-methylaminobutanoate oxidase (formaldehyde-forming)
LKRRLVQFALEDQGRLLYHNEPIWCRGRIVGRITSGMYGHTIGRPLGMGYVAAEVAPDEEFFEIEVAGECVPARASLRAFYDPANRRVRDVPEPRVEQAA